MQAKISKILKSDAVTSYGFPVTYVDDEGVTQSYNVFTDAQFRQIAKQLFGSRIYNDWDDETTETQLVTDFATMFSTWKATRADTYGRRMYALSLKYNPLENYNGIEKREGSFTHGESIELSFDGRKNIQTDDTYTEKSFTNYKESTKDDSYVERSYNNFKETTKDDSTLTRSYNQYKEQTQYGAQTVTNKISADDASAFVNSAQTENGTHTDDKTTTGSYTDEHGYDTIGVETATTGSYKDQNGFDQIGNEKSITGSIKDEKGYTDGLIDEKVGTETTAHSGKDEDEYTITKSGNLGVTTSQQMLASDMDLLRYDITMTAIKEFIYLYTYLDLEVE